MQPSTQKDFIEGTKNVHVGVSLRSHGYLEGCCSNTHGHYQRTFHIQHTSVYFVNCLRWALTSEITVNFMGS